MDIDMSQQERVDGRQDNQIRTLGCERGLLSRADGSARWSQDESVVLAAVYGPRSVPGYKEDPQRAIVEVSLRPKHNAPGSAEVEVERAVCSAVKAVVLANMHPRTAISIIIQIINDDGAALACCINAACAALVDAGISLTGLISAVSVALQPDGTVMLDPLLSELQESRAHVTLAFSRTKPLPTSVSEDVKKEEEGDGKKAEGKKAEPPAIVTSVTSGSLTVEEYFVCIDVARAACAQVGAFFEMSLHKYQRGWQMFSKNPSKS